MSSVHKSQIRKPKGGITNEIQDEILHDIACHYCNFLSYFLPNIVELLDCSGFFMFSSHRSLEKIEDLKACNKLRRLGDVSELAHVKILVKTRYTEGYLSFLLRWRYGTTLALLP